MQETGANSRVMQQNGRVPNAAAALHCALGAELTTDSKLQQQFSAPFGVNLRFLIDSPRCPFSGYM